MTYENRKEVDITPADTNVEAGTEQPSEAVDLGGEEASVVMAYSTGGSGSPDVSVQVKYAGNGDWATLDHRGSTLTSTASEGEFHFERPVEQARLLFKETGATAAITINSASFLAYYGRR